MGAQTAPATAAHQWRRRPWLSRAVRAFVAVVPILVGIGLSFALTRVLPGPVGAMRTIAWWALVTGATVIAVALIERVLRRLLPLAALLNLTMVFPDRAPQRFTVARAAGSPSDIRRRLEEAQARGIADTDTRTMQVVLEMAAALSVHDKATRGHSERVRVFTDMIAAQMHLSGDDRSKLRWASLLHDIGKLRVSPGTLNKPAEPTEEEWEELRRHPAEGARLLGPVVDWLGVWGQAIVQHHERWDGKGYPLGVAGEEISLGGRIVAVADSFETMTAPRPYRRPVRPEAARQELVRCAGAQFDPAVVRAFLEISLGKLGRAVGISAWAAQIPALSRLVPIVGRVAATAGSAALGVAATVGILAGGPHGGSPATSPSPVVSGLGQHAMADAAVGTYGGSVGGTDGQQADPGTAPAPGSSSPPETPGPPASTSPGGSSSSALTTSSSSRPSGPTGAGTGGTDPASSSSSTSHAGTSTATATTTWTTSATSTAKAVPPATPAPTPAPSPIPKPFNCDACTNTSSSCTSYCNNANLPYCTTYCQGNNNRACQSYCFGSNNAACTQYCQGSNNPKCVSNCQGSAIGPPPLVPPILGVPLLAVGLRRRLLDSVRPKANVAWFAFRGGDMRTVDNFLAESGTALGSGEGHTADAIQDALRRPTGWAPYFARRRP